MGASALPGPGVGVITRALLRVGERVAQGQVIVHAGSSGTAGFPHLHVELFPTVVWRRADDQRR